MRKTSFLRANRVHQFSCFAQNGNNHRARLYVRVFSNSSWPMSIFNPRSAASDLNFRMSLVRSKAFFEEES
jgi:hypothetical protein